MQYKSDRDKRPPDNEDVELRRMFRQDTPAFASVSMEAIWREALDAPPALSGQANIVSPVLNSQGRWIMWARMSAIGACAASACLVILFALSGTETVLGQVQDALKKTQTATYTVTQTLGDQPAMTWKVMLLGENLCRCEQPNGIFLVFDIEAKKIMEVNPAEKKVRFTENLAVPDGFNILATLANPNSIAVKEQPAVPEREIEGKKATGLVVEDNGVRYNVWIDPATSLPLEMEKAPSEPKESAPTIVEKWTEFRFNEPLDPSLFSLEAPKGYAMETRVSPSGDARKAAAEQRAQAEKAKEEAARQAKEK